MSLNALVMNLGAATCSVTGGTATTFSPTPEKLNGGGVKVVNANVADPRARQVITAYATIPNYNSNQSVWTDEMRETTFAIPVLQTDGSYKFRSVRVKFNYEAGISAADLAELRACGAQLCHRTELNTFYTTGSPA